MTLRSALSMIALAAAAGCTPNNAVLSSGEYMVFLSEGTSRTVLFNAVDIDAIPGSFAIDCRCEIVGASGDDANCDDVDVFGGSCTTCAEFLDAKEDESKIPDPDQYVTDLCWADNNIIYDAGLEEEFDEDGEVTEYYDQWADNPYGDDLGDAPRFAYESWLHYDTYQVAGEELKPWRGEAIITTEGDFQITFHHEVPKDDFRFVFAIDPDFQPQECEGSTDELNAVDVDGDWLAEWSEGVDGTMYFLNSGAYQFNPNNVEEAWFLPQDWRAGYAQARFGEEDFTIRSGRYGDPFAYGEYETLSDLYVIELEPEDLYYIPFTADDDVDADVDGDGTPDFEQLSERMTETIQVTQAELEAFDYPIVPVAHANDWREPDGIASGLDGWGEMHYNWVRIDEGSNLEVGGSASGSFHLLMEALDSQSRVMVQGDFTVENIKAEKWGAYDVQEERLEELGTELCVETR